MAANANLHKSKDARNDEFYTQISDIEKELTHYKGHFNGAVVFCNCDDPEWSNFWKYFHLNFEFLGLKKLITTHYETEKPSYKMEYEGGNDADCSVGTITPLMQNGDFRSPECIELLKEADIVVTNPPFSLMKEYIPLLMTHNKGFIILGNVNHITFSEVKPFVLKGEMWLGYNSGHFWFRVPDYYEAKETDYKEDADGQKWRRMGNSCWFTNLDIPKRHKSLDLWSKYVIDKYPKYDDFDAIECSTTREIPGDYYGTIGVPITYLPYHCAEQFEILEIVTPKMNNKSKYKRLLIKRVTNEDFQ